MNTRVANPDQAIAKAKLHKQNKQEQTASIEVAGNPALVAGRNIRLTGFEEFSGKWRIKSATHKLSSSGGYTTSLELATAAPTQDGKVKEFTRRKLIREALTKLRARAAW